MVLAVCVQPTVKRYESGRRGAREEATARALLLLLLVSVTIGRVMKKKRKMWLEKKKQQKKKKRNTLVAVKRSFLSFPLLRRHRRSHRFNFLVTAGNIHTEKVYPRNDRPL
uniref:Uncharacterized protein n=1 Tax=Caenorhabditis japonica TaxID=281687 RepID=A0A8R1EUD4_CAEJA